MEIKKEDKGPQKLGDLFAKIQQPKPPAYQWQDLALRIIKDLGVPGFKRNSVFKICKDNPQEIVEKAVNETKELCKTGEKWKYFFKVADSINKKDTENNKQTQV